MTIHARQTILQFMEAAASFLESRRAEGSRCSAACRKGDPLAVCASPPRFSSALWDSGGLALATRIKLTVLINSSVVLALGLILSADASEADSQKGTAGTEVAKSATYAALEGLAPGSEDAQDRQKAAAKNLPLEIRLKKTGLTFRLIPAGEYQTGSATDEAGRDNDEKQKSATIETPFYLGKFEVTQGQWEQVMGANPCEFKDAGKDAPVEQVSWRDCQTFITKLEALEGLRPGVLRLPSESEWELACRAGTTTAFYFGSSLSEKQAGVDGNAKKPFVVGSFPANAFGLHDMHGNVFEWCSDRDPKQKRELRILRGGSFLHSAEGCRSANRSRYAPNDRGVTIGFRLALDSEE